MMRSVQIQLNISDDVEFTEIAYPKTHVDTFVVEYGKLFYGVSLYD